MLWIDGRRQFGPSTRRSVMKRASESTTTRSSTNARGSDAVPGHGAARGLYLLAGLFLCALCLTLVAATQVEASDWWFGDGQEETDEPDRISGWIGFAVERMLHRLDATDEQSEKIQQIVADTLDDLEPLRDERAGSRERLKDLLTAETVDPEALESYRREHMARAEIVSQRLTETVAAIATELTPEQREQIADHLEHHEGRHWHRRMHR